LKIPSFWKIPVAEFFQRWFLQKITMYTLNKRTFKILSFALVFTYSARGEMVKTDMPLNQVNVGQGVMRPPKPPSDFLTNEEQQKVKAAHDAVLQQDPSMRQKLDDLKRQRQEVLRLLREEMIRVDPSVESLLDKMLQRKKGEDLPKVPVSQGNDPSTKSVSGP